MKLFVITFLFFSKFLSIATPIKKEVVFQDTDSLTYYYYIANNPKSSAEHPKAYTFGSLRETKNQVLNQILYPNNFKDFHI